MDQTEFVLFYVAQPQGHEMTDQAVSISQFDFAVSSHHPTHVGSSLSPLHFLFLLTKG